MAKDYESIDVDTNTKYDYNPDDSDNQDDHDFPSMLMKLCCRLNIKIGIFIFILGLFIFSDVFVRNVLSQFSDAVGSLNYPTTYGTIVQLLFLVFGYLLIDLLVQGKYI